MGDQAWLYAVWASVVSGAMIALGSAARAAWTQWNEPLTWSEDAPVKLLMVYFRVHAWAAAPWAIVVLATLLPNDGGSLARDARGSPGFVLFCGVFTAGPALIYWSFYAWVSCFSFLEARAPWTSNADLSPITALIGAVALAAVVPLLTSLFVERKGVPLFANNPWQLIVLYFLGLGWAMAVILDLIMRFADIPGTQGHKSLAIINPPTPVEQIAPPLVIPRQDPRPASPSGGASVKDVRNDFS